MGNLLTDRQPGDGVLAAADYGAAEPLTIVGVAFGAGAIAYAAWRARRER